MTNVPHGADWRPEPLKFSEVIDVTDQAVTIRVSLTGQAATIRHKWIKDRQGDVVFIPLWLCRKILADHTERSNH